MGLHSSLKRADKMTATRSVLKRTERINWLIDKGLWKEGDPVTGLPKIKVVRLKALKKEKVKEEKPAEAAAAEAEVQPIQGEAKAVPKGEVKTAPKTEAKEKRAK